MSGKRLLDAAALFTASRGVVFKHVAFRQQQLDAYTKTSSLAKAVNPQIDRVTLTVRTASALARRFSEAGEGYSTKASKTDAAGKNGTVPSGQSVAGGEANRKEEGIKQDHFYVRSEDNATTEPPPKGNLRIQQEKAKRRPLPDGSILPGEVIQDVPKGDPQSQSAVPQSEPFKVPVEGQNEQAVESMQPASSDRTNIWSPKKGASPLSANEAKRLQREAEEQIPSQAAVPPTASAPKSEAGSPGLGVNQEQASFYSPPSSSDRVLSSLPRVKVPKHTEDAQGSDTHVPDAQMNQDVFYSAAPNNKDQTVPATQSVADQDHLSDEACSEIFHSPRIAKMLRSQPKKGNSSNGLDLSGASSTRVEESKIPENPDQVSFSMRTSSQDDIDAPKKPSAAPEIASFGQKGEENVQSLAADISKDAETASVDPPQVCLQYMLLATSMLIS